MILHATPEKVLEHVIRIDMIKSLNSQTEDFLKFGYPGLGNISFTSGASSRAHGPIVRRAVFFQSQLLLTWI